MKKTLLMVFVAFCSLTCGQVFAQMPTVATDVSPMLVLETVPDAQLIGADGKEVSLYSLIGNKPTIIVFYRGVWCFNCTNNFKEEYVPNLAEIQRLGYNLIAISPDAPASLKQTATDAGMDAKYFYGDGTGALSKAMGLAWKQGDRMKDRLIEVSGGKNTDLYLPVPAVYIVGPEKDVMFTDIRPMGIAAAKRTHWSLLGPVLNALK